MAMCVFSCKCVREKQRERQKWKKAYTARRAQRDKEEREN